MCPCRCSYFYSMFECHFSWSQCSSEYSSYTNENYICDEGCKCQCCGPNGCGCDTNPGGWCD